MHGSYYSYKDEGRLLFEKKTVEEILGKPIIGIRQHYLNLDIPSTWEKQRSAGYKYDASFGYQNQIGYRDNIIHPFFPLDDNFLVIPLNIMDGPLCDGKDYNEAWKNCLNLIDYAEKEGALLTILWHNNRFNDLEYPNNVMIYEKIIEECKKRNAWIARCCDIFAYWRK